VTGNGPHEQPRAPGSEPGGSTSTVYESRLTVVWDGYEGDRPV
jgi:hypothetical protein